MNIIITGASKGIGKALAEQYANTNCCLGLIARSSKGLQDIVNICLKKGATTYALSCDISSEFDKLTNWINEFNHKNPIDIFIANAAITAFSDNGALESWSDSKAVIETNVLGTLACIHPTARLMQKKKSGNIVIISSLSAHYGMPAAPSYCASKAAIKNYGEALQSLLEKDNINVLTVFPGFVKTSMSDQYPHMKPFLISAEKAAGMIKKAIEKRKSRLSFPSLLSLGIILLSFLPRRVRNILIRKF